MISFSTHRGSLFFPFISGIFLLLTLPWVNAWALMFIALIPFLYFAGNQTISRTRLVWGTLLMGMLYTSAVVSPLLRINGWWWFDTTGMASASSHAFIFGGSIMVIGLWGALFFLPTAFIVRKYSTHPYGGLIIAATWTALEAIRSYALFGYSWGVLGYALIDAPFIKYEATLPGGVLVLSLLILLINMTLLQFLEQPTNQRNSWQQKNSIAIISIAIITFFANVPSTQGACVTPPLRVAVIASTLATEDSLSTGAYDYYRKKIKEALEKKATLIITPENSFPFFEFDEENGGLRKHSLIDIVEKEAVYEDFLKLSREYPEATIALGVHTINRGERFNSLIFYKNGESRVIYHKKNLVPFTEYAPFGLDIPIFEKISPGKSQETFTINGYSAKTLICSEIDHISFFADQALTIASSNDSVFLSGNVALVHQQMARMRALESGSYLLRSSKGGISSIIGPTGDIITEGESGLLIADIQPQCKS